LDGKVAFISGVARGQGRAHAVRMAQEGADIIGVDVCAAVPTTKHPAATADDLTETVRLVESTGRAMVAHEADVRDLSMLGAALDEGLDRFGRLDIVVANAGIMTLHLSWEITDEQWDTMMDVNLKGVWHMTKVAIPVLIAQGEGGVVIMTSSTAGHRGIPYMAHYSAAKHGVVGLARALALEVAHYDIRVHTVLPGAVETQLLDEPDPQDIRSDPTVAAVFARALPTTMLQPDDVAGVVAFLASDAARYMTGNQVPIDLGNNLM
jgi:SDR family mycofactocin-dependent oxidoreductase